MNNILILTGRFGMGHFSAATSLAEMVKEKYPLATVNIVDIFEYVSPMHYKKFYSLFTFLINHGNKFYNTFYSHTEKHSENMKPPFLFFFYKILEQLLRQTYPDVIISTLPFCSQLVSCYKKNHPLTAPLVTCITDISTHSEWINENTDFYLVGSPELKYELMMKGFAKNQIFVSGIPVKKAFRNMPKKQEHAKKHLLIMGGGLGLIPQDESFYENLNKIPDLKTTIILGNNKKRLKELSGKYQNIEVIGYTDQVYRYMYEADLLLSKPGGITTFEAIFSNLPLLVSTPFLEQEVKNAKFIQKQGFGKVIWDENAKLEEEIQLIFQQPEKLTLIREQMKKFHEELRSNAMTEILTEIEALHYRPVAPISEQQTVLQEGEILLS